MLQAESARAEGVPVEVVPGPVACATALVASGIPCEHFFFEGFLPRKAGERERRLRQLATVPGALLFYESPHRVVATLESIAKVFPTREAALCRELTKLHEEVVRCSTPALHEEMAAREQIKGEIVIVVAPPSEEEPATCGADAAWDAAAADAIDPDAAIRADIKAALEAGEPASAIAKRLSQRYSRRRREVYALVLELQQ